MHNINTLNIFDYGIPFIFKVTTNNNQIYENRIDKQLLLLDSSYSARILYAKPNYERGYWDCTINTDGFAEYIIKEGDIDQIGTWIIQLELLKEGLIITNINNILFNVVEKIRLDSETT